MKRVPVVTAIATATFVVVGIVVPRAEPTALRYPDVQPIFANKCASCHDARQSTNAKAQAVFEMSSYPFATKRPATLLEDLRRALPTRLSDDDDKARGLRWLAGGALDADGQPPKWR